MIRRTLILAYGTLAYALFLATFAYAIGFLGNFGTPTRLDGPAEGSLAVAIAVDVGLLGLFALQHSGMARPAFKRWLTRFIPLPAERSTYVLATCVALIGLFAFWRPVGGVIWNTTGDTRTVLYLLYAVGWATVLATTFLIHHFDLFGLRQVWLAFRGRPYTPLTFTTPGPYRLVRHPLYVGWLTVFWAAPTMTASHLLFATVTTCYILVAIVWEERDLVAAHPEYAEYRSRVPKLIPRFRVESGRPQPVSGVPA